MTMLAGYGGCRSACLPCFKSTLPSRASHCIKSKNGGLNLSVKCTQQKEEEGGLVSARKEPKTKRIILSRYYNTLYRPLKNHHEESAVSLLDPKCKRFMLFFDSSEEAVEIYYDKWTETKMNIRLDAHLEKRLNISVRGIKKWRKRALHRAQLKSPRYNSQVGLQFLSWIIHRRCFLQIRDIPGFISFSRCFCYESFEKFFKYQGIYPPSKEEGAEGIVVFYHCTRIPQWEIGLGYHLRGEFFIPSTYFLLEKGDAKNGHEGNCGGPVFKVSIAGRCGGECESCDSLQFFTETMEHAAFGLEYNYWKGRRKVFMLQVVDEGCQFSATFEMVRSMMSPRFEGRCNVNSNTHCFFHGLTCFNGLNNILHDGRCTIVCDGVEALKDFFHKMEVYGKKEDQEALLRSTMCALAISSCYLFEIMLANEDITWHDRYSRVCYVVRPSLHDMIQLINSLQHRTVVPKNNKQQFRIFETITMQLFKS